MVYHGPDSVGGVVSEERFVYICSNLEPNVMAGHPNSEMLEYLRLWIASLEAHPEGDVVIRVGNGAWVLESINEKAAAARQVEREAHEGIEKQQHVSVFVQEMPYFRKDDMLAALGKIMNQLQSNSESDVMVVEFRFGELGIRLFDNETFNAFMVKKVE